ncbi:MAG TPA: DMT family transporter [bacterium]
MAVLAWGLSNVATRYLLMSLRPLDVVTLRYSIAACLFAPLLVRLRRARCSWADLGWMALVGLFGVAGFNLPVTLGTQWLPAGTVGLLVATEPIWICVISVTALRERVSWTLPAGIALAAAGVMSLVGGHALGALVPGDAGAFVRGAGLVVLGAASWAVYAVAVRPFTGKYGPVSSTGLTTMLGTLPLLAGWNTSLLDRAAHLGGAVWGNLAFLGGVCTVLSTVFWNYGTAKTSAARAGPWLYLVPLTSVLGGHLVLGEQISASTMAGGAMIVAGVAITQFQPRGSGVGLPWLYSTLRSALRRGPNMRGGTAPGEIDTSHRGQDNESAGPGPLFPRAGR